MAVASCMTAIDHVLENRSSYFDEPPNVVDRAGKLDLRGSSHAHSLARVSPTANRKQGLTPRSLAGAHRSQDEERTTAAEKACGSPAAAVQGSQCGAKAPDRGFNPQASGGLSYYATVRYLKNR